MFGLKTLDVGIGMALMFLFVSIIASAIREFGELLLKTRAASLEKGIAQMLGAQPAAAAQNNDAPDKGGAPDPVAEFYDHPLISALFSGNYAEAKPGPVRSWIPGFGRNGLPSYIPSENFARAVLQIARDAGGLARDAAIDWQALRAWAAQTPGTPLQTALRNALDVGSENFASVQKALEQWFDSAMDRVSGWYKRRTQVWLFFIGLAFAVTMNIDAINVMKTLATDDALRNRVVETAGSMIAKCAQDQGSCPSSAPAGETKSLAAQLDSIKASTAQMSDVDWPIGWSSNGYPAAQYRLLTARTPVAADNKPPLPDLRWWLGVLAGWLTTAFGVTFGAAFWFDVLNKFMVVRSTIKPDEKSPKEKSKS